MVGRAVSECALRVFAAAVFTLATIGVGAATEVNWTRWNAGGVTFETPPSMRPPRPDAQQPDPVDVAAPAWTFTVTDAPDRPDRGATINFLWTRDATEAAKGAQTTSTAAATIDGRDAQRIDWRDGAMGWRGFDLVSRDLSPGRELFRFTCHAPAARWPEVQPTCERAAATIVVARPELGAPQAGVTAPTSDDKPVAIAPPSAETTPSAGEKPASAEGAARTPAPVATNDAPPSAPADKAAQPQGAAGAVPRTDFETWKRAATAILGAIMLAAAAMVALRRKRKTASSFAAKPPPGAEIEVKTGPRFCTECGARLTGVGHCPKCGAPSAGR